jgi:hypothetical protein
MLRLHGPRSSSGSVLLSKGRKRTGWEQAKRIDWVVNAYPRACYYLGYLFIEAGTFERAIEFLEHGLGLELSSAK